MGGFTVYTACSLLVSMSFSHFANEKIERKIDEETGL